MMKTIKPILAVLFAFFVFSIVDWVSARDIGVPSQNHRIYIPLVLKNWKPSTTSRYMQTTNVNTLKDEGRSQASESGGIVLYFGPPRYQNSKYGTLLYDYSTFASVADIESAVKAFSDGYWEGNQANPNAFVTIAIGTSNCGNGSGSGACNPGTNLTYSHGKAWADMIDNVYTYLVNRGYTSKIQVAGAIDVEPDWNTVQNTKNWIDGYVDNTTKPYYNFGTCDGCPYTGEPVCANNGGTINNSWTLEDVRYVSWGEVQSWPLPEIYRTDGINAQQWYRISLYSYLCHNGSKIAFKGTMSTWQACQDTNPNQCHSIGIDNQPSAAWWQLWDTLYADLRTRINNMPWLTDITWQN